MRISLGAASKSTGLKAIVMIEAATMMLIIELSTR